MSYSTHSMFTDPGPHGPWLDAAGPDLARLRSAAAGLVFHYWAHGDVERQGFGHERVEEVNLRYADTMLARLHDMNPAPPGTERAATERIVGCCRDGTLLFVSMARHHGIPARARVGFATYLAPGWALDHVIAEVWDSTEERWRLVEPQFEDHTIDMLDVPRTEFLVAADAWVACRNGAMDPEKFRVSPEVPEPFLRGWPYLTHNLLHDLAALNKREMILWDLWGLLGEDGPRPEIWPKLDGLADLLRSPDLTEDLLATAFDDDDLRVPDVITSVSPTDHQPRQVALRTG